MTRQAARRSLVVVVLCAIAAPAQDPPVILPPPTPVAAAPLTLDEVLNSVLQHFPLLFAAEQERQVTAGRFLSAQGAFDHVVRAREVNAPEWNSYPNNRMDVSIERGLGVGGLSYFAGYRIGQGEFPVYKLGELTADGGEFRGGVRLPLLRDSAIDRPRATLAQAGIDRQIAEPVIRRARLDYLRAAGRAYWIWVAAGRRLKVTRQLAAVAEERDRGLEVRVRQGAIAPIERTDNRQTIADRQGRLAFAERRFQEATISLSLYLRDAVGCPALADEGRLPSGDPNLVAFDPARADEAIRVAVEARPEVQRWRLLRERAGVDLRLAENQALPGVYAAAAGAQDVGQGKSDLDRKLAEFSVAVDLPIQRRDARGRVLTAQAQMAQFTAQERFAADQIAAEVRDTLSALDRAFELRRRAAERVEFARQVEEGERRKLLLGQSNILTVNLRELATFDALLTVIDAELEYFRALVDYRAALGIDVP